MPGKPFPLVLLGTLCLTLIARIEALYLFEARWLEEKTSINK